MSENDEVSADKLQFLSGGGQSGELIRSLDWEKTVLSKPEFWSPALKQTTSMMLSTAFPVLICWGEHYTQFYNDAFRPINGETKHPQAMGGSAKDTYAEIWDQIGPLFQSVMQGQTVGFRDFMVVLYRNGYPEECYFDFSYSSIRDEQGKIGGILVICMKPTAKINAIRQAEHARSAVAREPDRLNSFFTQARSSILL